MELKAFYRLPKGMLQFVAGAFVIATVAVVVAAPAAVGAAAVVVVVVVVAVVVVVVVGSTCVCRHAGWSDFFAGMC